MTEVVVVTGASGGVGRAIAHSFARRGARVGLLARGEEGLDGARREVEALGGTALVLPTDVADHEQVEAAADAVEATLGPIDVWVNDAMATVFAPFAEVEPEEFKRATEVTYLGTVYGTMSALRRMRARDRGTVVQVGSALAYRAIPLQSAYCGAKFGIRGFTDSVRTELLHGRSHVWITMVQLPAVNTPQFEWCRTKLPDHPQPVPPIYQPEVPAEAVYWAAHHRRRELDVGGGAVKAIFGNKLSPWLADRYLARTGYASQQIQGMPVDGRPDNLFAPVPAEAATHGMFDDQAHTRSYQLWASTHRRLLAGGGRGPRAPDPLRARRTRMAPQRAQPEPHVLREYALLADGERGILVGPRGDLAWMCFPGWASDGVFSSLLGGGVYAVTPRERFVWGGYYKPGSLIWRSRWVTAGSAIVECREALALPTRADRAVVLRRVIARQDTALVDVLLGPRGRFGAEALRDLRQDDAGRWSGRVGEVHVSWAGGERATV